jgi:UDP-N-acetylglucosamine 4,6-dehydratase
MLRTLATITVPADVRDLNYSNFFSQGKTEVSESIDYNSQNTRLLDVETTMKLLLQLPCVQADLEGKPLPA